MKLSNRLQSQLAVAAAVAATTLIASASNADIASGPGGAIPASGTGDGTWQTVLPSAPLVSNANVANGVASIQSITLTGISHTWVGDLHVVLYAPGGAGYNIFVRPGSVNGSVGNSGDFLGGTYTFVDPVGGNPELPTTGSPAPGTYRQSYNTWTSGNHGISNTGMNSISGAAGVWTLRIYDWAAGDTGTLQGWSMNYTPVPTPGALALLGLAGLSAGRRRRA